jgi:hypothetical protein
MDLALKGLDQSDIAEIRPKVDIKFWDMTSSIIGQEGTAK